MKNEPKQTNVSLGETMLLAIQMTEQALRETLKYTAERKNTNLLCKILTMNISGAPVRTEIGPDGEETPTRIVRVSGKCFWNRTAWQYQSKCKMFQPGQDESWMGDEVEMLIPDIRRETMIVSLPLGEVTPAEDMFSSYR